MALASYVRGRVECQTPLDISKCSGAVLTIEQMGVQINLTEYTTTTTFGEFVFAVSAEDTAKLRSGKCEIQLRGFVDGKEFYTPTKTVPVDQILLKEVLDDED